MIYASISSTEEKFVIKLRHKIDYVVEKKFGRIKSLNNRTIYVFAQLFFSITKLISKSIFSRLSTASSSDLANFGWFPTWKKYFIWAYYTLNLLKNQGKVRSLRRPAARQRVGCFYFPHLSPWTLHSSSWTCFRI